MVVTSKGQGDTMLLASGGQRPTIPLNILYYTGQFPPIRTILPKMFFLLKLRKPKT